MVSTCSEAQIRFQQYELLYRNLPLSLLVTVINAGLLAFLVSDVVAVSVAAGWFGANVAVSVVRYALYVLYRRSAKKEQQVWQHLFVAGVTGSAILWGLASVLLFHHDSEVHQVFLAFVVAGMVAGAVSSLSQRFFIYASYNTIVLIPLLWQFFSGEHAIHPYMGVMTLLFMGITLVTARRTSATIEESFRLRYANEELITELSLEKERVLDALSEAKHANRAKDTFLANMSHEIRTPLNGMIGFSQLLAKTELDAQQTKYVSTIEKSSQLLLGVLNTILDFSKLEQGMVVLESTCFALKDEIEALARLFETQAAAKAIEYHVDLHLTEGVAVVGDPLRLKQVLANLLSNAIKFTPQHGRVEMRVEADATEDGLVTLRFTVRDTGPGILPENLEKIFEPFSQEDSSISRRFGGTGLGLTICRDFVRLMGSELNVESFPEKGSTFSFELILPRCELASAPKEDDAGAVPVTETAPGTILVVEDNLTNQMVVEIMLEEELGYPFETVNNGLEAVKKIESGARYALVLMDISMPVMDGVEATRRIRRLEQERGLPRTPIIALSANVFKQDQEHYLGEGMDDALEKPLILDKLREVLQRYCP